MTERLHKIIAKCGICSTREAEKLIMEGRVTVNGKIVREAGKSFDIAQDKIKVDGKLLIYNEPSIYIALNKPKGYVCTADDPAGRPTVLGLVKVVKKRVFYVGRLDYDTEGLLLITDDGELAFRLTHPAYKVEKTYFVKVKGVLSQIGLKRLREGVIIDKRKTAPAKVSDIKKTKVNSWLSITIHEGRNRQVKRMLEAVGHHVLKLIRVKIGNIELESLPLGKYRKLKPEEIYDLKKLVFKE